MKRAASSVGARVRVVANGAVQGVGKRPEPLVTMKSRLGVNRIVDMLSGEQLPLIF